MKTYTFLGNVIVWGAIGIASTAFLAWYHLAGGAAGAAAGGTVMQVAMMLASPLLLFAIGAVLGLIIIYTKKIEIRRISRTLARIAAIIWIACMAIAAVPVVAPATADIFALPLALVVYSTTLAPFFVMMFGFFYALGVAPVDKKRRSKLDKYLPDDHFE